MSVVILNNCAYSNKNKRFFAFCYTDIIRTKKTTGNCNFFNEKNCSHVVLSIYLKFNKRRHFIDLMLFSNRNIAFSRKISAVQYMCPCFFIILSSLQNVLNQRMQSFIIENIFLSPTRIFLLFISIHRYEVFSLKNTDKIMLFARDFRFHRNHIRL